MFLNVATYDWSERMSIPGVPNESSNNSLASMKWKILPTTWFNLVQIRLASRNSNSI